MLSLSQAAGEFQLVFSLLMSKPRALYGLNTLEGAGEMHKPVCHFPFWIFQMPGKECF